MRVHLSPTSPRLRPAAILFDHDGTLVNSLAVVVEATNQVLRERADFERPAAEVIAGMVLPTTLRIGGILGITDPQAQRGLADDFYRFALDQHVLVHPYPGIIDLLAELAMLDIPMGVVSNNQTQFVKLALGHLGQSIRFGVILGEDAMPAAKPDPSGPLLAAERLGVDPARCWFVGDSHPDADAAKAAGMRSIGVTWGIHPRAEMLDYGFDHLIDTPGALLELFDRG